MIEYDSTADTLKHIKRVNELLIFAATKILERAVKHDASKLLSIEKECFDTITPLLKGLSYGSDEYKRVLKNWPAIQLHQKSNSHHPEFYEDGMEGFDLFDLVEMFFDWKAASERHSDGDILRSIEINKQRFQYPELLAKVFKNTEVRYFREGKSEGNSGNS